MDTGASVGVSMSDKEPVMASANQQEQDYSRIEITDPITQQNISNLSSLVETAAQLESIHI